MPTPTGARPPVGPSSRHQLAVMVWIAVVPTLVVLQLALAEVLEAAPAPLRPAIMATIAIPIVVYVLMPSLQRLSARLVEDRST